VNPFDIVSRASPAYVDAVYQQYRQDPTSVDPVWAVYFAGFDYAAKGAPPSGASVLADPRAPGGPGHVLDVSDLVQSYRLHGHLVADLDPLGLRARTHALLRLSEFGISEGDLGAVVKTGFRSLDETTIEQLLSALTDTYSGTFAVEYLDIPEKAQREWLIEHMEPTRNRPHLSVEEKRHVMSLMIASEELEQFLHRKYPGQKRFSLEGGEAVIPLLDTLIETGAEHGVEHLVMGMPHRGRLNVLTHTLHKPYEMLLAEFEGAGLPQHIQGDGDVKYHLGYSHDHTTSRGKQLHLALYPNPSHLEAVNPVVAGIARAKQGFLARGDRRKVMPVVLHGDAAVSGQGIVYETVAMSRLRGFTVGGTINVVVNNQIGFTTSPEDYSINTYPTDIAHFIQAPVFHVNGDDPEAAVQAGRLAAAYRQTFGVDVFINFCCYRKYGHNELDEPAFTQPKMYELIRAKKSPRARYAERLLAEGAVDQAWLDEAQRARIEQLEKALAYAREQKPRQKVFALGGAWEGLTWGGADWSADTRVDLEQLKKLGYALSEVPSGFVPHRGVQKVLDDRRKMIERGTGLDWGCGEALAFASLLAEGSDIRLSGQDSERGTFSHRHAVVHDGPTGQEHIALNHLPIERQGHIEIVNSLLSEAAVVGFEYGMSSADPHRLVIWEAQFGDFANGAQILWDQFVSSAESKWQRMSGLTLLLPHGYEGQGPEHSSARLERFLQLCAEGNMQVVNATTPAQLFHVLRRQLHRKFRKPLVVMSPKSLLRHPAAVSTLEELALGTFQPVIDDPTRPEAVDRVLLCSGKIYYALAKAQAEQAKALEGTGRRESTAIVRLEQVYPFPDAELRKLFEKYRGAREVFWVQEEPENQGAWSFVRPRLEALYEGMHNIGLHLEYVGRDEAASPAAGSHYVHTEEEAQLVREAFARPHKARQQRYSLMPKAQQPTASS
jgi:2-oxoglutarate dehydrogenase E1 component